MISAWPDSIYVEIYFQINDKNKRIAKIFADLNMDEKVNLHGISTKEKPELLLKVDDSEASKLKHSMY